MKFSDIKEVERISDYWGVDLSSLSSKTGLEEKLQNGEIKAALVFGEDILTDEHSKALFSGLEFLLVSDAFYTSAILEADVVLPASTHIEQEGTFTRCDHTIQKSEKIVNNPAVPPNRETIVKLACRFVSDFSFNSNDDVFSEIKAVNRYYQNAETDNSIIKYIFPNNHSGIEMNFAPYDIDLKPFKTPVNSTLYKDIYFTNEIKQKLI